MLRRSFSLHDYEIPSHHRMLEAQVWYHQLFVPDDELVRRE